MYRAKCQELDATKRHLADVLEELAGLQSEPEPVEQGEMPGGPNEVFYVGVPGAEHAHSCETLAEAIERASGNDMIVTIYNAD